MVRTLSQKKRGKTILTILLAVICILYVVPVFLVAMNSFKLNTFVKTETFAFPTVVPSGLMM